ncbi:hypothetical protein GCM10010415_18190 [Streptomyces atrovirens]|uniref:Uncharacterized protein n=1 Tax=Streptomyces atrovirens TaxID=285556 RepID=A0ABW0E122_9ACTN
MATRRGARKSFPFASLSRCSYHAINGSAPSGLPRGASAAASRANDTARSSEPRHFAHQYCNAAQCAPKWCGSRAVISFQIRCILSRE